MDQTEKQTPLARLWRDRARQDFDQVLDRITLSFESERATGEQSAADTARTRIAESLNQGLRRLRQTATVEQAAALAHEISAPFAARCALFVFQDGQGVAYALRGLGSLPLLFSPDEGAAFRAAIESKDPVIAVGTGAEISAAIATRVGTDSTERVFLFPVTARSEVRAILLAAGAVAFAPMELIAGLAGIQMDALTPAVAPKRVDLLEIQGAENAEAEPAPAKQAARNGLSWDDLPAHLQTLHLRAQREARLRVATIRLQHPDSLRRGLAQGSLYEQLRDPIDQARAAFRREYVDASPSMVDYLYLEMVRGLAQGDDHLLGAAFPGPLV